MNPNMNPNPGVPQTPMGAPVPPVNPTPVPPQPASVPPVQPPMPPQPPMGYGQPQPMAYGQPMANGMVANQPAKKKNMMPLIIGIIALVVVIVIVAAIFLLKDNGKKLECTMENSSMGMKVSMTESAVFDKAGKEVKKIGMKVSAEFPSDYDEDEIEKSYNSAKEECDDYKDVGGISCSVKKSGRSITQEMNFNLSKVDKDKAKDAGFDPEDYKDSTYDDLKKSAEDSGYTCK